MVFLHGVAVKAVPVDEHDAAHHHGDGDHHHGEVEDQSGIETGDSTVRQLQQVGETKTAMDTSKQKKEMHIHKDGSKHEH